MADSLERFFGAWGETSDDARMEALEGALAPGFTYSDPRSNGRLSDIAALSDYLSAFTANAPGWTARVVRADVVNGYTRALVAFGGPGPDGSEMTQHGTYFAETDDLGRIETLAGFVGAGGIE